MIVLQINPATRKAFFSRSRADLQRAALWAIWLYACVQVSAFAEALAEPASLAPPASAAYRRSDGAIALVGYNDMQEMLEALSARYTQLHPTLRFALELKGTRTGPPALAAGTAALAPMGAEFSPLEIADYRAVTGSEPVAIRIAHASLDPRALSGPLAILVHRSHPLAALTVTEVAEIFSGKNRALGLIPVGLKPETALGLYFKNKVLGEADFASDFVSLGQSRDVVKWVEEHPGAIGFAAAVRASDKVKFLALAARTGAPGVELNPENLVAGRYPLDRHLLMYARVPLEPWVRDFLGFILSPEGQRIVAAGHLGYLPLGIAEVEAQRAQLNLTP